MVNGQGFLDFGLLTLDYWQLQPLSSVPVA
jgi:hypothetical protein